MSLQSITAPQISIMEVSAEQSLTQVAERSKISIANPEAKRYFKSDHQISMQTTTSMKSVSMEQIRDLEQKIQALKE